MTHCISQCSVQARQNTSVERMADQCNRMKIMTRKKREDDLEHVEVEIISRHHDDGG